MKGAGRLRVLGCRGKSAIDPICDTHAIDKFVADMAGATETSKLLY